MYFQKNLKESNKRNILKKFNIQCFLKDGIYLIIGTIFMSLATTLFLLGNQLSTGGFSGIATILFYYYKFPVGSTMIVLNIPLLLIAFFKIDKRLFLKSIVGTILLSIFIDFFTNTINVTFDKLLACIYGGALMGLGNALVFIAGASTGGSDLLTYIIKSFNKKFTSGNLIMVIDTIIIFINVLCFGNIEIGLYSAISIFIMGKIVDFVYEGVNFTKILFIISEKNEEIASIIGEKAKRGSTALFSKGTYSQKNGVMLFCVASAKEIIHIKKIIKKIDRSAFIVTCDAKETLGKGFVE